MIKIEKTDIFGWESAIRGMRNPLNSWSKSDSHRDGCRYTPLCYKSKDYAIGSNDLNLMQRLANAGSDHAKFLRMINVTCDIVAPLYWWKEYDTYKVGTVANSCSTMHKIHEKEFALEDFSCEHLLQSSSTQLELYSALTCAPTNNGKSQWTPMMHLLSTIAGLNHYREKYLETKDKTYWWQMIQLLPSSYNQKRTVQLNYQVLLNMYHSRKNHKLDEWHTFCDWIERLPYFKEICLSNNKED
nr:MAG TPA: hypothetical protein [Caudoviricetes sp.]